MNAAVTRVALVTGSNRGLGLALVRGLAEQEFHVVLTARTLPHDGPIGGLFHGHEALPW